MFAVWGLNLWFGLSNFHRTLSGSEWLSAPQVTGYETMFSVSLEEQDLRVAADTSRLTLQNRREFSSIALPSLH